MIVMELTPFDREISILKDVVTELENLKDYNGAKNAKSDLCTWMIKRLFWINTNNAVNDHDLV